MYAMKLDVKAADVSGPLSRFSTPGRAPYQATLYHSGLCLISLVDIHTVVRSSAFKPGHCISNIWTPGSGTIILFESRAEDRADSPAVQCRSGRTSGPFDYGNTVRATTHMRIRAAGRNYPQHSIFE